MKKAARRAPSRFRLSADVRPSEYALHLEPDLERGTFRGEVRIAVTLRRATDTVRLHAADMMIDTASAVVASGEMIAARARLEPADEVVALRFRRRLPAGEAALVLRFHAKLGQQLRGFYAAQSGGRRYAFTQLEAADARRMMPCFDEPSFKARFRIAVTVPAGTTAVSNGAIEGEAAASGGRRTIRFSMTPPLSTYLLALAVGVLESSPPRMLGATEIRVWHVPGKGHLTDFSLDAAAASLARLETYFGIPYPYGKLDLVAVPDFEAGAMENAGAVFFRETLLLLDPKTASLMERKRAAEVIAHELAHMWYGDLVTMAWWDDLWLNEAFATWMAYRVIDDWKPEWRMWPSYEHDRAGALALDALANTHPIYARVRSVAEATENFDAITYEKGAAVVRMIEHYLGADAFRDGVRIYMARHRESNAVAADLWRSLEEASGREVTRVAQAWIEKAGFPLVRLERVAKGLRVRQERFFADPTIPAARRRGAWPLPLVLRDERGVQRTLVDGASAILARPRSWVFGNADAGGFYRVLHDEEDRKKLAARLADGLSAVERMAFAGDQWAMVRAGHAPADSYLDVVDALAGETDYDVVEALLGPLSLLDDQVVEPGSEEQRRYRAWLAARFGPELRRLGWSPTKGEDDGTRLRRAALVRIVGLVAEDDDLVGEAGARLEVYLRDRSSLDPNLADPVVGLAAIRGDVTLYSRYREIVSRAETPQERRRFLLALGSFRTPEAVERTLAAALTAEIPTQDVGFVLMRLFGNPAARERTWKFFTAKWAAIRRRIPPLMISRLVEATPGLREPRYAREVARFFREHPVPEASRAVKQALEVFRLNAELRKRAAPALARWLARAAPEPRAARRAAR